MNLLILFEIFLLILSFYSIASFEGVSKFTVPLACLFCIFWVQKLEKKVKEEEEDKRRLLQYKLDKHHRKEEKLVREIHIPTDSEE